MDDEDRCPNLLFEFRCMEQAGHNGLHTFHNETLISVWPDGWAEMTPDDRAAWVAARS